MKVQLLLLLGLLVVFSTVQAQAQAQSHDEFELPELEEESAGGEESYDETVRRQLKKNTFSHNDERRGRVYGRVSSSQANQHEYAMEFLSKYGKGKGSGLGSGSGSGSFKAPSCDKSSKSG
jgi:hypothetical protein